MARIGGHGSSHVGRPIAVWAPKASFNLSPAAAMPRLHLAKAFVAAGERIGAVGIRRGIASMRAS
jgi:hypothetical protein